MKSALKIGTKSIVAALLCGVLLSFTACRGGDPDGEQSSSSQSSVSSASESSSQSSSSSMPEEVAPPQEIIKNLQDAIKLNSDTVGWLRVPNTEINNAVLQAHDNDFYLRRDETKNYNYYGCYFADYDSHIKGGNRNTLSKNTIVYGHSMEDNPNGLKFSQLKKYTDVNFCHYNPHLYFSTETDDMIFKVFAVYYTDIKFNYIEANPSDEFLDYIIEESKLRSMYNFAVDVNSSDKILTLSTCTYRYGSRQDQRFVVVGRLLRPGESAEETVNVTENPNPKPPQF